MLLFFALLAIQPAQAQGWERLYAPGNTADFTQTTDGGFLLAGNYVQDGIIDKAWLLKTDADGNVEWTRRYAIGDTLAAYTDVQLLDNQHFIATGEFLVYDHPEHTGAFLHKLDATGELVTELKIDPTPTQSTDYHSTDLAITPSGTILHTVTIGNTQATTLYAYNADLQPLWQVPLSAKIYQIEVLPDGSLLLCGAKNSSMYLCKTDAAGALLWEKTYEAGSALMALLQDGNIALAKPGRLLKVDADGKLLWAKAGLNGLDPSWIREDPNGNLLVIGYYNANFTVAFTLGKFDANGNEIWRKTPHQSLSGNHSTAKPLVTSDGGIALAGHRRGRSMLIRSDAEFDVYRSWIAGSMFHDQDDDCSKDPGEKALKYFYVSATDANGTVWTENVAASGFAMQVPAGTYQVAISKRSFDPENWLPCDTQTVTVSASTDTAKVPAIGVRSLVDCPRPHIRAAIPKLRSCYEGRYSLNFYNLGTQLATDVQIEVELAENLTYTGSSLTLVSQNGQKLLFQVGDLDIDDSGSATIDVLCSCDAAIGDLSCSSFRILPDSCYPVLADWDHSVIKIDAAYNPSEVSYTLQNVGTGDMAQPRWFRLRNTCLNLVGQGTFQLEAGATQTLSYPNQAVVYYFEAEPEPNQPYLPGNAVLLSNCQPGQLKESWMNNDTGSPFYDVDCSTVSNSFDPNDIQVTPRGDGEDGAILANESELRYMVRFQNTGNDTAFTVSIRDTLPGWLDALSVVPGPSSHAYTFDLQNNVVKFHFSNINLPDSSSNLEGSQGFVVFTVRMQPNLVPDTRIENRAAIYFDFNQPVLTNTALNTIRNPILVSVDAAPEQSAPAVRVVPNPASDRAVFYFDEPAQGQLLLFDAGGREIGRERIAGEQLELNCRQLLPGIYFFHILRDGAQPVQGKLVKN
ncbi:MAG: hypothetical protein IT260_21240 [Saprospiraceae bacterium]|nr:hypothetical protein [Saprospiraceae bacterium]